MSSVSKGSELPIASQTFFITRWIFLRLLGVVYLAAFLSLWVQVEGLVGSRGILPVGEYLEIIERHIPGVERFYLAPTVCWIDASDQWLQGICLTGAALACLLILGLAPTPTLFLLWALYLSLTVAGQELLSFQWDTLLLETGFLAIFLAPLQLWPRPACEALPSPIMVSLFRWLLFRLMFVSGAVKLLTGDPTWRNFTALSYHFETQPLPAWTSWYMHQLPGWFLRCCVLFTFVAELLVPLLIFGPRRCRHIACAVLISLQLLIAATGNYGFFNLLTIALCVLLLDDAVFPTRWRNVFGLTPGQKQDARGFAWSPWLLGTLATALVILSVLPFIDRLGLAALQPTGVTRTRRTLASFHFVNGYGLFAVMSTQRPEIIIEGSNDGRTWYAYEFKWKPGDLTRAPRFAGLHMPRLDWQMWFAALGRHDENRWFDKLMSRLQDGSPEVLALFQRNPFPEAPPRFLRATLWDYHFTSATYSDAGNAWWSADVLGPYFPGPD